MDTSAWTGEETAAAAERVPFDFKIEREAHKLEKRLCREAGKAIVQYNMIEEGDKVMVCMSGGKDSYTLLDILLKLKARAPIHFELIAVNLDQKQPGFPEHVLPDYLRSVGVPFHIENEDTYSIVKRLIPEGKTTCSGPFLHPPYGWPVHPFCKGCRIHGKASGEHLGQHHNPPSGRSCIKQG